MEHKFEGIIKDLSLRQNREVTSAQLDDIKKAKQYLSKDLDNFVEDIKDKSFVQNAINPVGAIWDYEEHKLCQTFSKTKQQSPIIIERKTEEKPEIKTEQKTNDLRDIRKSVKNNKSTIVQLSLLDEKREKDAQKVKIRYPIGLLDEFILGYQKIINWLEENHFDALTLDGSNDLIRISQHEFETAINFLEKMKLISEEIE